MSRVATRDLDSLLAAAVGAVGGSTRPGQEQMAHAVARAIGQPAASRAVGTAIGSNRIAYLIPCHRVLQKSGGLGGYRWGTPRKQAMLAREAGSLPPVGQGEIFC